MSGTKAGASKAVATMLKKHGKDYYARIGAKGGKAKVPKGLQVIVSEQGLQVSKAVKQG